MAFHSFSWHRVLFFQGGWLPRNSKYNWRNGFDVNPLSKAKEQSTMQWLSWGSLWEIHICSDDCWECCKQYFIFESFPDMFPSPARREMSIVLAAPWPLKAAFLEWCLPSQKTPLVLTCWQGLCLSVPVRYQGAPHNSTPTSMTPFLPILFLPSPFSSFPHLQQWN